MNPLWAGERNGFPIGFKEGVLPLQPLLYYSLRLMIEPYPIALPMLPFFLRGPAAFIPLD